MSGGGLGSAGLLIQSSHTPTAGYLEFLQNKRDFSPAVLELLDHLMLFSISIDVQVP